MDRVTAYLDSNKDFRGFDDKEGWRHGVAHSADVILQLVLNDKVTKVQLTQINETIARHINPKQTHFYIFGESERLMRPIAYAMLRDELNQDYWQQWLKNVSRSHPLASWGDAFSSEAGLAQRHNVQAFLQALYVAMMSSEKAEFAPYREHMEKGLAALR